jgi:hypothetical protein
MMAALWLSMRIRDIRPPKNSKAFRWQRSHASTFWSKISSAYMCRL